jgi:hypothetical protein
MLARTVMREVGEGQRLFAYYPSPLRTRRFPIRLVAGSGFRPCGHANVAQPLCQRLVFLLNFLR